MCNFNFNFLTKMKTTELLFSRQENPINIKEEYKRVQNKLPIVFNPQQINF